MDKWTLNPKFSGSESYLFRNGEPQICPFTVQFVAEGISYKGCGTWCPHFHHSKTVVRLSCGGRSAIMEIGEMSEEDRRFLQDCPIELKEESNG